LRVQRCKHRAKTSRIRTWSDRTGLLLSQTSLHRHGTHNCAITFLLSVRKEFDINCRCKQHINRFSECGLLKSRAEYLNAAILGVLIALTNRLLLYGV
jgi:hypothetical protein